MDKIASKRRLVAIIAAIGGFVGFSIFPATMVVRIFWNILFQTPIFPPSSECQYALLWMYSLGLGVAFPWALSLIDDGNTKAKKIAIAQIKILALMATAAFILVCGVFIFVMLDNVFSSLRSIKNIFDSSPAFNDMLSDGCIAVLIVVYMLALIMQCDLIKRVFGTNR